MSKARNFFLWITILVAAAGCTDILDQEPKTTLAPGNFYTNIENFEVGVNGAYDALRMAYSTGELAYWRRDLWTDNMVPSASSSIAVNVTAGELTPFSPLPGSFWEEYYASINTINEVLVAIEATDLTETETLHRLEGELLFLRSMLYIDLVMLFGDIPYLRRPPGFSESFFIEVTPKTVVWENIHADLDRAIDMLPATYEPGQRGRATQGAALALQARAWLYDTGSADHWNRLLDYTTRLIDNAPVYGYTLYDDGTPDSYYNLFTTDDHPEDIFSLQHSANLNNWGTFSNDKDVNSYIVTTSLVEAFETTDGRIVTDTADPGYSYFNKEPRFAASILHVGGQRTGTDIFHFVPGNAVFAVSAKIKKGVNYSLPDLKQDPGNQMLLRYADVLLMHAEALNETSDHLGAIDFLKMVRDRAGLPTSLTADYTTVQAAIRHERRVEFCFEGTRYFDIVRWDIGSQVFSGDAETYDRTAYSEVNGDTPREAYPYQKLTEYAYRFIPERRYLFPIPDNERRLNSDLPQNLGY